MRTHDTRVGQEADREANAGDPGTVSLTPVPRPAPNVRVAPAASRGRNTAPGPGGAWCDVQDTGTPATGTPDAGEAPDAARRPGRPRSERAEQSIIEATIEALAERGIDGVHCEDVAARAGVGKATLYRRWGGKEDLLIAAFAAMKHPLPQPRGESVREDLITLLTVVAADADDPRFAQQYALLHGAGERYPRLVARYREQVVEPRRDLVRSVLRRGIETGELRPGIDVEVAMLMLTGAVMARGKHDPTPAAPGFVDRAVDELLRGIAVDRAG
jgi:AcrR family transcriptional regulator